jgi:uncharacterized RDD family membrane protein YckC
MAPDEHESIRAPAWRRLAARVVDWAIVWALFFCMQVMGLSFWILDNSERISPRPWGRWFLPTLTVAALSAAADVLYTTKLGQTPGKDLLGIRVHAVAAQKVSPVRAGLRSLLPALALALPLPFALAGLAIVGLPALVDREQRSLADRLARTRVVPSESARPGGDRSRRNLIPFGMEKWIAGVTGDVRELPDPYDPPASTSRG